MAMSGAGTIPSSFHAAVFRCHRCHHVDGVVQRRRRRIPCGLIHCTIFFLQNNLFVCLTNLIGVSIFRHEVSSQQRHRGVKPSDNVVRANDGFCWQSITAPVLGVAASRLNKASLRAIWRVVGQWTCSPSVSHRQSEKAVGLLETATQCDMKIIYRYMVAQKTGPVCLIANILKTPWLNCVEISELLQYYMLNTVISFHV